jgi:hypothetical protein
VRGRVGKKGTKSPARLQADIARANARFDRLLDQMAKTPALPKKKRRVAVRHVRDDAFDD